MINIDDVYEVDFLDDNERESAFSVHPVNASYELTEDTLLGKEDIHFESIFNKYRDIIKGQLRKLYTSGNVST